MHQKSRTSIENFYQKCHIIHQKSLKLTQIFTKNVILSAHDKNIDKKKNTRLFLKRLRVFCFY